MPEPTEAEADGQVLATLPKEVGVLLLLAGIGGVLLPGPIGTPFLLVGGLIFFPKTFEGLDRGFRERFPKIHREGLRQVLRFVSDLERRYPSEGVRSLPAPPSALGIEGPGR